MSGEISYELGAYSRIYSLFSPKQRRKDDYEKTFSPPHGERVIADLRGLTMPHRSQFDSNPFVMARNVGRNDVWVHIRLCLEWNDEKLAAIAAEADRQKREEAIK